MLRSCICCRCCNWAADGTWDVDGGALVGGAGEPHWFGGNDCLRRRLSAGLRLYVIFAWTRSSLKICDFDVDPTEMKMKIFFFFVSWWKLQQNVCKTLPVSHFHCFSLKLQRTRFPSRHLPKIQSYRTQALRKRNNFIAWLSYYNFRWNVFRLKLSVIWFRCAHFLKLSKKLFRSIKFAVNCTMFYWRMTRCIYLPWRTLEEMCKINHTIHTCTGFIMVVYTHMNQYPMFIKLNVTSNW